MDICPVDLPLHRDETIVFLEGDNYRDKLEEYRLSEGSQGKHILFGDSTTTARAEVAILQAADLYSVSGEMTDLAQAASVTLPDFKLAPEDVPSRVGFLAFQGDLAPVLHGSPRINCVIAGYSWCEFNGSGVMIQPFAEREQYLVELGKTGLVGPRDMQYTRQLLPRMIPMIGRGVWAPYGAVNNPDDDALNVLLGALKALRATWLLMSQPIASVGDAKYDRPARRRFQKQGKEPPRVRVITLRRPAGAATGAHSDREWHHRWIVKGHWRQQWLPSRQVHRPTWIAPHVKGPEGAPLLGGEKVYSLSR